MFAEHEVILNGHQHDPNHRTEAWSPFQHHSLDLCSYPGETPLEGMLWVSLE